MLKKCHHDFWFCKSIVQFNVTFNIKRYLSKKSLLKSLYYFEKNSIEIVFPKKWSVRCLFQSQRWQQNCYCIFFVIVS